MTGDHSDAGCSKHSDASGSNQNDLLRLTLYKKETARLLEESDYLHEGVMASLKDWAELFHGKLPVEKVDPVSKEWQQKCDGLRLELLTMKEKHNIEERKLKLELAEVNRKINLKESDTYKETMKNLQDRLADAKRQLIEREKWMKKLHNSIVDLKGNIRVYCRVRPFLTDEDVAGQYESVISYPTSVESRGRGIELLKGTIHSFTFDSVFGGDASQHEVFCEVDEFIQSVLDGYKVCIFSYGQTGSGKTFTMMGKSIDDPDQKGLIPRSLEKIFQATQSLTAQGRGYEIQASVLEIYNDSIRDLLATKQSTGSLTVGTKSVVRGTVGTKSVVRGTVGTKSVVRGKQQKILDDDTEHKILLDANNMPYVSNLKIVDVCGIEDISRLLKQAESNRVIGKTQMNDRSSRSHMVFKLQISGVNQDTEKVHGVLNFVDLAGSERVGNTKATAEQMKETQAINSSLHQLGNVIRALAEKKTHVPYRNTKLTHILEPYLGKDSKTMMFVNISPNPSSASESLDTLEFAERVNGRKTSVPQQP